MKSILTTLTAIVMFPVLSLAAEYEVYQTPAHVIDSNSISLEAPRVKNIETGNTFFVANDAYATNGELKDKIDAFLLETVCEPLGFTRAFASGWQSKDTHALVRLHTKDVITSYFLKIDSEGDINDV